MKPEFRVYVENKLQRDEDRELFRDLLEAYYKEGPEEVKKKINELVRAITRT